MGLFIDRIREITGLVKVASRLVVTPYTEIPGIVIASQPPSAGDALGTVGYNDLDVNGNPLPERGYIVGAKLIDPTDTALVATVHIYSAKIPGTADNAALAHTAVDVRFWITSIPFSVTTDVGAGKVSEVNDWDSCYYSPTRTLWWQFSTAGTPTVVVGLLPMVQFFIVPCSKP